PDPRSAPTARLAGFPARSAQRPYSAPGWLPCPIRAAPLQRAWLASLPDPRSAPTARLAGFPARSAQRPYSAPGWLPCPIRAAPLQRAWLPSLPDPRSAPTARLAGFPARSAQRPYSAPGWLPCPIRANRTNTERHATIVRETACGRNNRQIGVTLQPAQALRGGIIRCRGGIIQAVGEKQSDSGEE